MCIKKFFLMVFAFGGLIASNESANIQRIDSDINSQYDGRFYIDESKPIDDAVNRVWEEIPELKNLLKEATDWRPCTASFPDYVIENITLMDILRVCINGDVRCNEAFKDDYVRIFIPKYVDFTGLDDLNKGELLLCNQKGRYVAELFKYGNCEDTYIVAIGVIKHRFIDLGRLQCVRERIYDNIDRRTKGKSVLVAQKEYRCHVVRYVHNGIYFLKVRKAVYDTFMKNAKKYDAI